MLNLASAVLAMWLWLHGQFHSMAIPQPVVIEHGASYGYSDIYNSVSVPDNWEGTCDNQRKLLLQLELYYNNWLRTKQSEDRLQTINKKWECVE